MTGEFLDGGRLADYMKDVFYPGAVLLTTGMRGGGKTHTAVAVCEKLVKGEFPTMRNVVLATNVIFYHKVRGKVKVETPPGVYHITTMLELWPIVVDTIGKYGRDCLIILLLDEAQGFLAGDSNSTNESKPMKEMLGTIRKYNLAVWFLTPSKSSVGPAFRNLMNDPQHPGNLTCRWLKDIKTNKKLIAQKRLPGTPREYMAVVPCDARPCVIRIPVTEWTGSVETLKEGEYCYDHIASATFTSGEGFDFNAFNQVMGGVASIDAMATMREYLAGLGKAVPEAVASQGKDAVRIEKAKLAREIVERGLTWDDASAILKIPKGTLKEWDMKARKSAENIEKEDKKIQTRKTSARRAFGRTDMARKNGLYISLTAGGDGGALRGSEADARYGSEEGGPGAVPGGSADAEEGEA